MFVNDEVGLVVVPRFGVALGTAPDSALEPEETEGDREAAGLGRDVTAVAVLMGVAAQPAVGLMRAEVPAGVDEPAGVGVRVELFEDQFVDAAEVEASDLGVFGDILGDVAGDLVEVDFAAGRVDVLMSS